MKKILVLGLLLLTPSAHAFGRIGRLPSLKSQVTDLAKRAKVYAAGDKIHMTTVQRAPGLGKTGLVKVEIIAPGSNLGHGFPKGPHVSATASLKYVQNMEGQSLKVSKSLSKIFQIRAF